MQNQNMHPNLSYSQAHHISVTVGPFMEVNKKIISSISFILQMGKLKSCDMTGECFPKSSRTVFYEGSENMCAHMNIDTHITGTDHSQRHIRIQIHIYRRTNNTHSETHIGTQLWALVQVLIYTQAHTLKSTDTHQHNS